MRTNNSWLDLRYKQKGNPPFVQARVLHSVGCLAGHSLASAAFVSLGSPVGYMLVILTAQRHQRLYLGLWLCILQLPPPEPGFNPGRGKRRGMCCDTEVVICGVYYMLFYWRAASVRARLNRVGYFKRLGIFVLG